MKIESLEEFLNRGGQIQKIPPHESRQRKRDYRALQKHIRDMIVSKKPKLKAAQ